MNTIFSTQSITIGERAFEVSFLKVEDSRKAWVHLQPSIGAMLAAVEVSKDDGVDMGLMATASISGYLTESSFKGLCDIFAKTSSFTKVDSDGRESKRFLKDDGVLDACFGGAFEDLFTWLDFCIQMNFSKQFAKLIAATVQRENAARAAVAAKAAAEKQ